MNNPTTSYATLLTGPSPAAIAVIRIIGPLVPNFLHHHFSKPLPPHKCVHADLHDGPTIIDDPIIVATTDQADISLHGGPWVVRAAMNLLKQKGFQELPPGNSVLPPESVDDEYERWLPLARTELALKTLLQNRDHLRGRGVTPDDGPLYWLLHPPRVAIVGAPNVGKSTLANELFGQERSIVADLPGTTRDWVGELADINGLAVQLIDTPGQRDTPDPIEHQAITRSTPIIKNAHLVIVVLDAQRGLDQEQQNILAQYPNALLVINKTDQGQLPLKGIQTIAVQGTGIEELRTQITQKFGCPPLSV